jgi:hypothetical protein
MKSKYPQFKHLELDKHGHFIGTFHNALNHCKTKHFFLLQHDISLEGTFPIQECLKTDLPWNIIATHHFKEDKPPKTHWFPIMKITKDKNLLKSWGWSERIFLSKRDWMMDKIYEYYHKGKTKNFIESIFHKEFDKLWKKTQGIKTFHDISTEPKFMKVYNEFWNEWKIYNLKGSVAYHVHLHGRTAKRKQKKITKRKTKRKNNKAGLMVKINEDHFKTWKSPHRLKADCEPCALNFLGFDLETSKILSGLFGEKGMPEEDLIRELENKYPHLNFQWDATDANPETYEEIIEKISTTLKNNYAVLCRLNYEGIELSHTVIFGKLDEELFYFDTQSSEYITGISEIVKKFIDMKVLSLGIIIGRDKETGEIYKDDYSLGL